MKTLLGWIFNRWVLAALGFLAISLLIWWVGPLFGFGDAHPLESPKARWMLIGALISIYLLHKLWGVILRASLNGSVLKNLMGNAAAQTPTPAGTDASSTEVVVLQKHFENAITTLKQARFAGAAKRSVWENASARVGQRYLYELPWYIIIGAPGSGKTTALVNSGLEFPLAASGGAGLGAAPVRGVGGTRNCDWWFTNQAVMIDTAGRYTTQDSDADVDKGAWSGFLNLLKQSRPRQPINGVLVTVSVADLFKTDARARATQASAVRKRVQELHAQLGIRFPIYLLVTKCDLMAGFMDYLGDGGKDQRQDPWGFTFAMNAEQHTDLSAFSQEFDLLQARLTDGLIDRLQQERDPARRSRIYAFPQQFFALHGVLKDFVEQVFSPSQFEERPLLRGVYMVSGTQEGTPIDRVIASASRAHQLGGAKLPENRATGKSFFISRLLQDVVFKEAELAGTNLKWERRRSWLAVASYALIGALFLSAAGAWALSYVNNRKYVAQVTAKVEGVRELVQKTPNRASSDVQVLLPALAATKALAVEEHSSVPWSHGFGLYQGRKLDSATQQVYKRMLVDALQPRIVLRVEEQLNATFDNPEAQYEALKTYRMLQDTEHFDAEALKLYVTTDWELNLPRDVTTEQRALLESHLDALLAQGPTVSPLPEDKALVAQVRARLASVPLAQRVYNRIRRSKVGSDMTEFNIAKAAGPSAALVFRRESGEPITRGVPGLYTYDGYHRSFQLAVEKTTLQLRGEEGWVLGLPSLEKSYDVAALSRLTDDVRRFYLNDYTKLWETYIADIRMLPMGNLANSVQMARILSGPDNPLAPLIRAMVKETTLAAVENKTVVDQAANKAKTAITQSREQLTQLLSRTGVTDASAPIVRKSSLEAALVDERFESLRRLSKASTEGGAAPIDGTIALVGEVYALLSATETAVRGGNSPPPSDVPNKVKAQAAQLPEPVRGLLTTLSASGSTAAAAATRTNLSQLLNSSVGEFCRKATSNRYPFARASSADVTQEDFSRLFAPGGLFDDFFQKNLTTLVDTTTRPWRFRQLSDANVSQNSNTLAQFQRAAVIRDTFFRGGNKAALQLEFKPQEMDAAITQFTLDFDGQLVKYSHGPLIPAAVQWPGPRGSTQVRVQLQPALANGSSGLVTEGPWALFRLFDKLQLVQTGGPERFKATFNIDNRKTVFEVTTSSVVNPFRMRELADFSCPSAL
jgi:type VI secretion system protein ImpL